MLKVLANVDVRYQIRYLNNKKYGLKEIRDALSLVLPKNKVPSVKVKSLIAKSICIYIKCILKFNF